MIIKGGLFGCIQQEEEGGMERLMGVDKIKTPYICMKITLLNSLKFFNRMLTKNNRSCKFVQSTIYACMGISQCNPLAKLIYANKNKNLKTGGGNPFMKHWRKFDYGLGKSYY
jgi:hypothetical protein